MRDDLRRDVRPLRELMADRQQHMAEVAAIEAELQRRGISRTRNLIGEIGERLTLEVYGGSLVRIGAPSIDLVAGDGRRLQVKVRELPVGVRRHFQFGGDELDFDAAICIRFDRSSFQLMWAREIPRDAVVALASLHVNGPRLSESRAMTAGRDVSTVFSLAWERLQATA